MELKKLLKLFEAGPRAIASTAQASGIADPNKIRPGQKITIPMQDGGEIVTTVQKGDTLSGIINRATGAQSARAALAPKAPAINPNQANALRVDQTAGGKTNADFLPGAAGGARPDAMAGADSSGYNAQSQSQKTPAAAGQRSGGIAFNQDAGTIPGQAEPAATDTRGAAAMASRSATTPGQSEPATKSSLPITTTDVPTAANPEKAKFDQMASNNTRPFSQYTQNQATKSYDSFGDFASAVGNKVRGMIGGSQSAPNNAATAMASKSAPAAPEPATAPVTDTTSTVTKPAGGYGRFTEEELEEELNELMRLSGRPVQEKAPPTAKGERMVKHIKQGYGKDEKLTDKEKGIAYATAWKAHNKDKVSESIMLEAGSTLEHIVKKFKHETKNFLAGNDLDNDLYDALYDYYSDNGEMPYGVAKARDGDPYQWISNKFADEMQMHGYGRQTDMLNMPGRDHELTELARLAGLSESQVVECGDMDMDQPDSFNVSTNMSSDGTKSVSISAQGDKADALLQMLKMAGMRPHDDHDDESVVMISSDDEMMEEEYANEPEEEYQTVDSIIRQGNDLNREKRQYADKPKLGDNPMAESILDEELQSLLDSILIKDKTNEGGAGGIDAEQPYRDSKTGKMIYPPKGATMPPPDNEFPAGDKRNLIPPSSNPSTKGKK